MILSDVCNSAGYRIKNCFSVGTSGFKVYTEKILESAHRMPTMIGGVLTYSSLDGTEQKMEILGLNKILSDIWNDLEVLIEQKGAVIQYCELSGKHFDLEEECY